MSEQFFTWRNIYQEKPMIGGRFVAVFDDFSGAGLFIRLPNGNYRCAEFDEEEIDEENMDNYLFWAYLPSGTKLWFEIKEGVSKNG